MKSNYATLPTAQLQNVHSNLTKLDIFPLYNFPKIWENFTDEQKKIDYDIFIMTFRCGLFGSFLF